MFQITVKISLSNDGQQFHQYQQKQTTTSRSKRLNTNKTMTYYGIGNPAWDNTKMCRN
jgi:hypothetical protein